MLNVRQSKLLVCHKFPDKAKAQYNDNTLTLCLTTQNPKESLDKCSAVAETDDRFATTDMGRGLWMQACLCSCNKHTTVSYM